MAGVGLVHGMAHAVGARCGVAHGTANGILLPHVMRFNVESAGPKLALVARALGCEAVKDEGKLALAAADAVASLLSRIGHPTRLSEVGVDAGDFTSLAALALSDPASATNPRALRSADEIVELYRRAL